MEKSLYGYIHSVESLSAVDGPDLRAVLFFQGCPLRCLYCHNPDTWAAGSGDRLTAREAADKMLRYKPYLKTGGVTLSGGEPLMQPEFAEGICRILRAEGMHTAIDTGGGVFGGAAARALDACDLVILDIKHTDPEKYRELTGGDFSALTGLIGHLERTKKPFWVRQVIISGVNDNTENILRLKELAKSAMKIELLPYHTMGAQKYAQMGLCYPLEGVPPTSKAVIDRLRLYL